MKISVMCTPKPMLSTSRHKKICYGYFWKPHWLSGYTKRLGRNKKKIILAQFFKKRQLIILLNQKCLLILHGAFGGLLKYLRFIQSMLGYPNSEATEIYSHITTKGVWSNKNFVGKVRYIENQFIINTCVYATNTKHQ